MNKWTDELTKSLRLVLVEEARRRPDPVFHPSLDDLDRYRLGKLTREKMKELREHVVTCGSCSELLLDMERFDAPSEDDLTVSDAEINASWGNLVESELMSRVWQEFPIEEKALYRDLLRKRAAGSLSPEEHQELIRLTHRSEIWQAERLEALADLADFRGATVDDLLQEFNFKPLLDD